MTTDWKRKPKLCKAATEPKHEGFLCVQTRNVSQHKYNYSKTEGFFFFT